MRKDQFSRCFPNVEDASGLKKLRPIFHFLLRRILRKFLTDLASESCCDDTGFSLKIRTEINRLSGADREEATQSPMGCLAILKKAYAAKGICTNVEGLIAIYLLCSLMRICKTVMRGGAILHL